MYGRGIVSMSMFIYSHRGVILSSVFSFFPLSRAGAKGAESVQISIHSPLLGMSSEFISAEELGIYVKQSVPRRIAGLPVSLLHCPFFSVTRTYQPPFLPFHSITEHHHFSPLYLYLS
jgi:hypothetical protein